MNDNEEENGDWIPDQVWNDKFGIVETGFRVGAGKRAGGYTHTTLLLSK
jgi:hypothetical protein